MITVSEAKERIITALGPRKVGLISIEKALNCIVAEDVIAIQDIPAYAQSSMDGYALRWQEKRTSYQLVGEIPAGLEDSLSIQENEAIRIFTGAPLPDGADTVLMQEKAMVSDGVLTLNDPDLQLGLNVRPKGFEVKEGVVALQKGELLTPAAIGYLAMLGIEEVSVYLSPKVVLIATGNELQSLGTPLTRGKVYDSNSITIRAALKQYGVDELDVIHVQDSLEVMTSVFSEILNTYDLVLLTGGVSVGDYDFVPKALQASGVEDIFHRVKQRPGKPLYFGKKANTLVFGLPGNPSSVLTCFYEYVTFVLNHLTGKPLPLESKLVTLGNDVKKPAILTQFLKGYLQENIATALGAQESYRMSSFARANCFICLPEGADFYAKGTTVEVHLLPGEIN